MQILNMGLTGLLVLYVIYRQKPYGAARACVTGAGFFAVAFYLDSIFYLIMENGAGPMGDSTAGAFFPAGNGAAAEALMQGMGIFLSKGILCALLTAAEAAGIASDRAKRKAPGGNWQYLDGLTVGITMFSLVLGAACLRKADRKEDFPVALRLVFLLILLLAYYISLYFHQKKLWAQRQQEETETREREETRYLKTIEDQYQRARELRHDLKNHISLLRLLLQEGSYDKMADYLRIFGDDVDGLTIPVRSGNPVVDALLADKSARAKKDKIRVELSLCDLTELSLNPDEICSLLGNLMDNALEASREVPEGRFLSVECRKSEDSYYIKVQNAAAPSPETAPSFLQSRKSDRRNQVGHGLGMRSMERIVHANGGELAVDRTENRFTVVVRLPVLSCD